MPIRAKHQGEVKLSTPFVKRGALWVPVQASFVKHGGAWVQSYAAELVVTVASTNGRVSISTLFTSAEWANSGLKKVVIIPEGVEIEGTGITGAIEVSNAIVGPWSGELVIINYGRITSRGGVANSGKGGTIFNTAFKSTEGNPVTIYNYGFIGRGGGGGGRGGNGGPAANYQRSPASGWNYANTSAAYMYEQTAAGQGRVRWNGATYPSATYVTIGTTGSWTYQSYTYLRGPVVTGSVYRIARQLASPVLINGGIAGNAGKGEGWDGPATTGSAPVAGGAGAGASGRSGNGGAFGQPGEAGLAGANGGYAAGTAGAAGGLPGDLMSNPDNVEYIDYGTTL